VGNITSFSQNKFDKRVNILRSSVEFGSFGLRAKVFRTKNNRKGRDFTIPVTGDWLCGVTPLQEHFSILVIPDNQPIFQFFENGKRKLLTYNRFLKGIKEIMIHMREDPKLYGGNSLRKLAATLANSADLSDRTIQRLGDWVKPSTLRFYINVDLDTRLDAQARIHSKAKSCLT